MLLIIRSWDQQGSKQITRRLEESNWFITVEIEATYVPWTWQYMQISSAALQRRLVWVKTLPLPSKLALLAPQQGVKAKVYACLHTWALLCGALLCSA